jgi:predicted nucleic acid-binding protein
MTSQRQIVADTSGLYALVDRKDPNHARAAAFLRAQTLAKGLLVSNHVFDETMTLVKLRLGTPAAIQLGLRLRNSQLVELLIFPAELEAMTWRSFSQYQDKAWSYTDCSCLVLAQQRTLTQAFTFDRHFVQMGLHPVPAL